MKMNKITNNLPEISILIVSILIVYWFFGQKSTFNYLVIIALSMVIFRRKEIKNLFVDDIVEIFKEEE